MKSAIAAVAIVLLGASPFAQRPSDPALVVPQTAPELNYVSVPNPITVPAGTTMGASASVAFDAKGHVLLPLSRPGVWLVKAVHITRADKPGEWNSLWASLTFEVPGGP